MSNTIIVYHDKCHDGITALWCARQRYPDAEAYPGRYDVPPDLDRLRGKDVIIVDFSWKRPAMLELSKVARSVLVLDHHASAKEELQPGGKFFAMNAVTATVDGFEANLLQDDCESANIDGAVIYTVFDMERSGAGITWDVLVGGPRPPLVDMVEDRDLWRFAVPETRAVHAALASYPLDYDTRVVLMQIGATEEGRRGLINEGQAILRYHDERVRDALPYARPMRFDLDGVTLTVPSVCLPHLAFYSDIGHELAKTAPFAVCWYEKNERVYLSLRSIEGGYDVSKVAEYFGGGGHPNAAGCTVSIRLAASMLTSAAPRVAETTVYVVYEYPTDFPNDYVLRAHDVLSDGTVRPHAEPRAVGTLSAVRAQVPRGLCRMYRGPNDPPQVLETYI